MEFLKGIRLYKDDISFLYDYEGKFSGESFVKLHNEADYKEALSFNMSDMGNRYIEIFETNENEWNKARQSQFPDKREISGDFIPNWGTLNKETLGIIRLRGLPYSCTEEDIRDFFRGFGVLKDGIKRAVVGGKPSGECFVLFENKEEAISALNLNMEKIGQRFIELFVSNVREFETFMQHNFVNNAPQYSRDHMPNIPVDKRKSTLMVIGLPFTATKDDLISFFNSFDVREKDIHMLTSNSGKFSGNSLITFEDELTAQRALKTKNLSYIGNRYIEIYEYR